MAEFKVREVDFEEKSVQETEEALLQNHAEKQIDRDWETKLIKVYLYFLM